MGTSLLVAPVNMLPTMIEKDSTLVLLNMEKVGNFNFENPDNKNIFLKGSIDDSIYKILKDCGWMVIYFI
jgi:NAD-dependent SIR2 family protein deacetylase